MDFIDPDDLKPTGFIDPDDLKAKTSTLSSQESIGSGSMMSDIGFTQEDVVSAPEEPKISFNQLISDPDYFKVISDYKAVRFNEPFKEGMDKEEYVKDFMSKMRSTELNVVFGAVPELNWMRNAPHEALQKSALAQTVYDRTASALSKEGQSGFRPYWDTIRELATDPTSYVGFFAGKAALGATARAGLSSLKSKALTTTTGAVTEGMVGAASDVITQKIEQQTEKGMLTKKEAKEYVAPDIDKTRMAAVALLTGVLGAGEGYLAGKGARVKQGEALDKYLADKKITAAPGAPVTKVEDDLAAQLASETDIKAYGKQILDQLGPVGDVTDAKIQTEMSQRAVRVALNVIADDKNFSLQAGEKVSTAIARVFGSLETIDNNVLEAAIRRAGLTPEQFAAANKMTVTDAAKVMQQYSVASKFMAKLREINPDFDKQMKDLYKETDAIEPTRMFFDGVRWVERQSKGFVTSGIDTTIRNVVGTNIGLTVKAASDLIEGFIYTTGKALEKGYKTVVGKSTADISIRETAANSIKNAFGTFFYMKNNGLAADITDKLLEHNPSIRNHMLSALQEVDNKNMWAVTKVINTLNTAQDVFYRRSVFAASVQRQLRDQGIDLFEDVLVNNKQVPTAILSKASDDALKATFSYMPKTTGKGTLEGMAESGANVIVRGIEQLPFSSLAIPFPRFMANAMAFQYRYSPLGVMGAGEDAIRALATKDEKLKTKLFADSRTKLAQSLVGSSALIAAYHYRMENPDSKWYEVATTSGTVTDIRAVFPLAPYFAVADWFARQKQGLPPKSKEMTEAIAGMKLPAGSQNVFLDQITAAISSEKDADKVAITTGKMVGDFFGRFTQPFIVKNIYDVFDLFRPDGSIARDPNVIDDFAVGEDQFVQAAKQRIQGRIPVLKEELPAAIPRLREGPVVREGEFFGRLVGFRNIPNKTAAEREIDKLDIDPYRLYGGNTGDKFYDRLYVEEANKLIIPRINNIIKNENYQKESPINQRIAIANSIRDMAQKARQITNAKMKGKDLDRIYKMRFDKLPEEYRMFINNEYAKEHNGIRLDEARDYRAIDSYEPRIKALRYAAGGLIGKMVGKAAKGSQKGVKELMQDMQQTAQKTAIPPDDQSMEELVTAAEKSFIKEPTPPAKTWETVEGGGESQMSPDQYWQSGTSMTTDHYKFTTDFFKGFPEEEIVKVEKELADKYGDVGYIMQDHPEAFANELAFKIQKNMGIKNKEIPYLKDPTNPDSGWDELSDVGVKPKDFEPSPFYVEKPKKQNKTLIYNDAALSGKLDDVVMRDNRNELLDQIRDFRTETFPTLKKINDGDIEDIVIGKTQGEFRFKTGHEVDITDQADLNLFFKIAKKEQSLLDKYRKQYADEPDVTLFHGGPRAESILQNKGLTRPTGKRDFRFGHSELNIGATSFTRDVNLGLNKSAQMDAAYGQGTSKFGGANPKNYIKTTIPYPEYKFLRINMSVPEYDNMDLNVLAKAVSGDPVNTRPVGLPRSTFYEHEDAVIEPDKFYVSSAEKDVRGFISPKEDFSSKVFDKYGISPAPAKLSQKEIVAAERQFKAQLNVFKKMDKEDIDALSPRELNDYYSTIKSYLKLLVSKTQRTDPSAGVGQQYHKDLENMVTPNLKDLASALSDRGSTEKAYLISRLSKELDDIRNIEYVDKKESILPVKRILDLTDKFSRGGLASKQ